MPKVVLVTTTFSTSLTDIRAKLALRTCREAAKHDYHIIVVDNSLCGEFKETLRATGAEVLPQQNPGMGNSRRECLRAGLNTGAEVIVWLEPEKYPLVSLLEPCIEPIGELADVVVPRRRNLENYPKYQQWTEFSANWELGNITGRPDLDLFSGPRIMSRKAAEMMAEYQGERGDNWEILFIPVLWYLQTGMRVKSVVVNYVHPIEQRSEDDELMRHKRDQQRHNLVSAMAAEAALLSNISGL